MSMFGNQYIPIPCSFDKARFVRDGKLISQAGSAGLLTIAAEQITFESECCPLKNGI